MTNRATTMFEKLVASKDEEGLKELIPLMVGTSPDQKHLVMILRDPEEMLAWHRLMDDTMPRVCMNCGEVIDEPYEVEARVTVPIDPDEEPVAMSECTALCPKCNFMMSREYAEYGYPFISAEYVQKVIIKSLRMQKKAGEKREQV